VVRRTIDAWGGRGKQWRPRRIPRGRSRFRPRWRFSEIRTLGSHVGDAQPGDAQRSPGGGAAGDRLSLAKAFDVEGVRARLESGNGGYEVVYSSPNVEIGVYVLVAPEPDRQQPHVDDEVYVVLEGRGVLDVDGKRLELTEGRAAFVPAGAEHRFVAYENLSVLVIFERSKR
jgi:mannose-6-phosphate isomerase-like protein (cupin superfamily)